MEELAVKLLIFCSRLNTLVLKRGGMGYPAVLKLTFVSSMDASYLAEWVYLLFIFLYCLLLLSFMFSCC